MGTIYKILNKQTGDFYIGSTRYFTRRKTNHLGLLKRNNHHSVILQRAYNKYGQGAFVFEIIEECDSEQLLIREQFYLETLSPKYNIAKHAAAPMKDKKHDEKTIRLMSKIKTGVRYPNRKRVSEEVRQKMSKIRQRFRWDDKVKAKMSVSAKRTKAHLRMAGYRNRCIVDQNGKEYPTLKQAAKELNCSIQAICDNLKGRSKGTRNGYKFKYKEEL